MKGPILRVAVPSPLLRCFDYLPPPGARDLRPGIRLRVPFGRTRQVGMLLELPPDSPIPEGNLRPALEVLDAEPLLGEELLELARWAIRYYHHPPGEVLATLLPVLLRQGHPAAPARQQLWYPTPAGLAALADPTALGRAPRQRQLLTLLAASPEGLTVEALHRDQPGGDGPLRALQDKGWAEKLAREVEPLPQPSPPAPARPLVLNPAQAAAVAAVADHLDRFQTFLLNGVTGSGKTEVYLSLVERVLAQGRQALLLVPEIGLTPQLLERVGSRLAVPLAVLHSGLNDRQRLSAWLAAREGKAPVVIGTRSAIFAPLPDLGLIVVDEEHDGSFKQQEGFRYHARDLAVVRAHRLNIPVVLGSATPSLESLHNARQGRYRELSLPARVGSALQPVMELIDLRRQELQEGLSRPLLERMKHHLARGEQVLLFLNRRGFAPTLICHECGWLGHCRHCDARLTLHRGRRRLICHHCGYQQPLHPACPDCGSVDLRALGAGTERIEAILKETFPDEGIARIDRDSTRRKGSLEALLDQVQRGERRILLGTQMLAKGHHFPDVTLVGIIDADQGLFGSDFRAPEHMAQLIIQVAGRAGRADKPGRVAIQTHHPEHPLLNTLLGEGYPAFAAATLEERRQAGLPPFGCQALVRADARQGETALAFLERARERGTGYLPPGVELLGPIPAPMERRAGRWRAQLLVQADGRRELHGFLGRWIEELAGLPGLRQVRWSLDVDPMEML